VSTDIVRKIIYTIYVQLHTQIQASYPVAQVFT